MQRRVMKTYENSSLTQTKYYSGSYEKIVDVAQGTKELTYISAGTGLAAVFVKDFDNSEELYYIHSDYLGSIMALSNESGSKVEEYFYDAWGQRKNPNDWSQNDTRTGLIIDRGYTGHEHWEHFNLINMNGRVYDPDLGRFLSPDPMYQQPAYSQLFNKYSYVINNPLKYIDPSGYSMADYIRDEYHRNPGGGGYINWDLVNWANSMWSGGDSGGRMAAANYNSQMTGDYIAARNMGLGMSLFDFADMYDAGKINVLNERETVNFVASALDIWASGGWSPMKDNNGNDVYQYNRLILQNTELDHVCAFSLPAFIMGNYAQSRWDPANNVDDFYPGKRNSGNLFDQGYETAWDKHYNTQWVRGANAGYKGDNFYRPKNSSLALEIRRRTWYLSNTDKWLAGWNSGFTDSYYYGYVRGYNYGMDQRKGMGYEISKDNKYNIVEPLVPKWYEFLGW